jgi:hypothetical protein
MGPTGTNEGGTVTLITLSEFLMARIAEDEAVANAVKDIGSHSWSVSVVPKPLGFDAQTTATTDKARTALARHFDPARILAECDATRLIMAIHCAYVPIGDPTYSPDWLSTDWCVGCRYNSYEEIVTKHIDDCPILRALALPFASHADFRDEWNSWPASLDRV